MQNYQRHIQLIGLETAHSHNEIKLGIANELIRATQVGKRSFSIVNHILISAIEAKTIEIYFDRFGHYVAMALWGHVSDEVLMKIIKDPTYIPTAKNLQSGNTLYIFDIVSEPGKLSKILRELKKDISLAYLNVAYTRIKNNKRISKRTGCLQSRNTK